MTKESHNSSFAAGTSAGLPVYEGPWTFAEAAHLLRRATFAPTYEEITEAVSIGREATLSRLMELKPLPLPPTNYYYPNDPAVPIGESWLNAPNTPDLTTLTYRFNCLNAWLIQNMVTERMSMREKMTFFWHNHFGCIVVHDANFIYQYNNTLREHALCNFRDLVKEVTVSPQMLVALDGFLNNARQPNENFAREFLELYTLGKGNSIAPGNYEIFTEQDVKEIARALTGWRVQGFKTTFPDIPVDSLFMPENHDSGSKHLSAELGGHEITDQGEREYSRVIDLVFQQQEAAFFICRKLYRFFVYYEIDPQIEVEIITPMALALIHYNFEIRPVLRMLFRSKHFYKKAYRGALIKSPLEYCVSIMKQLYVTLPESDYEKYLATQLIYFRMPGMQLEYIKPPEVAGWQPYYQGPSYNRLWINGSTLQARYNFAYNLSLSSFDFPGFSIQCDPFRMLEDCPDPTDPRLLVRTFASVMFPQEPAPNQVDDLVNTMLITWSDSFWAFRMQEFLDNPQLAQPRGTLGHRIRLMLLRMLSMAEFHLF